MVQLDNRSDKELEDQLERGEFGPRKAAFAKEILRRREEAKGGPKFIWIRSILAVLAFGGAAFKKLWRK
jgi:hypothetical protein